MNRPSTIARAALVIISIASLIAVTGLSVALNSRPDTTTAPPAGLRPGEEIIRVGLLHGPSAAGEVTVRAETGFLVVRSEEYPDGIAVPGVEATVRVAAAGSRTERVYRLSVGEYSDQLGAEKRLAELSARLGRPVPKAVSASGRYYVAYIGRSNDASDMDKLKEELGLTSLEAAIDVSDLPQGALLEITCDEGSVQMQTRGGRVVFDSGSPDGVLFIEPCRMSCRGAIEVVLSPEGMLEVVNEIALEDYLRSAVGSEMSSYAPAEALKAQAVLMRTYVINHMAASKHDTFHVCNTHHCQAYRGVPSESERVKAAVDATAGEILGTSDAAPVQVYYHSACGGLTESSGDVWGSSFPHLVSTLCWVPAERHFVDLSSDTAADQFIESRLDSYCREASNYRWERTLSEADLLRIVRSPENLRYLQIADNGNAAERSTSETAGVTDEDGSAPPVATVSVVSRTPAGRVSELEVTAGGYSLRLKGDIQIRTALGDSGMLPSCFFVVEPTQRVDGSFVLKGAGYGHGVGMCQAGAVGMAGRGYDYKQILEHYFCGACVVSR